MAQFDLAFNYILKNEGGVNEHPRDRGGITKYGISLMFLRSLGNKYDFNANGILKDDILNLTLDQAKLIYQHEFWNVCKVELIASQMIANYVFDMIVNMGQINAIKVTQRALWGVGESRFKIKDDGVLGPLTLSAIDNAGVCLMAALRCERAAYYRMVVKVAPEQKVFLEGWLNRTYES